LGNNSDELSTPNLHHFGKVYTAIFEVLAVIRARAIPEPKEYKWRGILDKYNAAISPNPSESEKASA